MLTRSRRAGLRRAGLRHAGFRGAARQVGFSLLEVLIAAVMLLVIAVGVAPMFSRALQSNTQGGRASVMSTFVVQNIEAVNQTLIDHEDWDIDADVLDLGTRYWDSGNATDNDNRTLGAGQWSDVDTGAGIYLWERTTKLRKYTFADVIPGTIDVDGGGQLVSLGHPELYDMPLADDDGSNAANVHVVELRVKVEPRRDLTLDLGQKMTVGHFRAY